MANNIPVDIVLRGVEKAKASIKKLQELSKGLASGTKSITSKFSALFKTIAAGATKLGGIFINLIGTIGKLVIAFAALGAAIIGLGIRRAIKESSALENALIGLSSVARNTGNSVTEITDAAKELAADGVIPLSDVSASLKNLLASGLDADKAIETFKALREAAAFNRQGQLSLAEAVRGATDGIKNQNSILVDNAGITKNISILVKEYAQSIGQSVASLTEQQKQIAIANGVIREARTFQGDYNRSLNTFTGAITKAEGNFRFFLASLGEAITKNETVIAVIDKVSEGFGKLRKVVQENQVEFRRLATKGVKLLIQGFASISEGVVLVTEKIAGLKNPLNTIVTDTASKNLKQYNKELKITEERIRELLRTSKGISEDGKLIAGPESQKGLINVLGQMVGLVGTADEEYKKLNKRAEELKEKIGDTRKVLDKNNKKETSGFLDLLKKINKQIQSINTDIQKTKPNLEIEQPKITGDQFDFGFAAIAKALGKDLLAGIKKVAPQIKSFLAKTFDITATIAKSVYDGVKEGFSFAQTLLSNALKGAEGAGSFFSSIFGDVLGQIAQGPKDSEGNELDIARQFENFTAVFTDLVANFSEQFPKIIDELLKRIPEISESLIKGILQLIPQLGDAFAKLAPKLFDQLADAIPEIIQKLISELPRFIDVLLKGLTKILSSLFKSLPSLISNLAAAFGPIIQSFAKAIPEIINELSRNLPAIITAIVDAIPVIINAILDGIPVIVQGLVDGMPSVIEALIKGAPALITSVIKLIPNIVGGIIRNIGPLIGAIATGIGKALSGAGKFLVEKLKDFPRLLGNAAIRAGNFLIQAIVKAFNAVLDVLGSGVKKVGSFLGFAKGGKIPKGFNQDNYPLQATSGEYVIDRGLTEKLESYLSKQGQGTDNTLTNSLLSSILSTLQNEGNISTSVEFNQDTLADILINLNRTGTRTA